MALRFLFDNCYLRLQIGRLNVSYEPPFKPGVQTFFESRYLTWRAVRRNDDLFMPVVEGIECMKELLLSTFLPRNELNVVDEEDIEVAVPALERGHRLRSDGVDEFVHEGLGGDVAHALVAEHRFDVMADRVQQVGLAEASCAVDEQGVVRAGRCLRYRECRRVGV